MPALTPLEEPRPLSRAEVDALASPPSATGRPLALLLLSPEGTEIYDLLAPYEALAASGVFDVVTAGLHRGPHPLTGRIAVVPDYALADAPEAELLVVPAVANPDDPELVAFVRERGARARLVLSICEGARLVARAGLLDGRRATTHFFAVDGLDAEYESASFVHGHRFVLSEPVLSSAGVSAALDASLEAVAFFAGEPAALATEARLGAAWHREDDRAAAVARESAHSIGVGDAWRLLSSYLRPGGLRVGLWLRPGVSEIALAAAADALPRTLRVDLEPVADTLAPIRTRHGLVVVPSRSFEALDSLDLLVVPGPEPAPANPPGGVGVARVRGLGTPLPGRALREALDLIALEVGPAHARTVATMLELPAHEIAALGR